jgi:hypothetical protein
MNNIGFAQGDSPAEEKIQIKHNWLYSVVPQFPDDTVFSGIYLAGYCKQCRSGFTVKMKADVGVGRVVMDKLDIPVWGCEPVE